MKRDMALILKILRFLRESDHGAFVLPDLSGHPVHEVQYHLDLCQEAGFVRRHQPTLADERVRYLLTWTGHEMLGSNCDG